MAMNDIGRPLCQKSIISYVRYRTACRVGIRAFFLLLLLFLYVVMEAFKNELDSEFQLLFVSGCYLAGINPSTERIRTNPSPQPGIQASYDATYPLFNYLIYVLTLSKLMRLKGALTISRICFTNKPRNCKQREMVGRCKQMK